MIAGLGPYPAMTDSGVPWLGEVPVHWEVVPALAAFRLRQVRNTGLAETTVLSLSHGRIIVKPPERLHGLVPESFETYQIVEPGNIIIRPTDLQNDQRSLRVGRSKHRGIITSAYMCLETRDRISGSFGYQYLNACDLLKVLYRFGSGLRQNLDFSEIKRMAVLVPSLPEQAAIASFLDHVDRRIRRYIRVKQKLIELLEEHKRGVIHRAVTRGLDSNVRLTPSGAKWLGAIPEHWQSLPTGRLISLVTSGSRGWAQFYSDGGDAFIQSGNLGRSMALDLSFLQRVRLPGTVEGERTKIQRDDVLVCITGALTGNVVHVADDPPGRSFVNQHVALMRPERKVVMPRYLAYVLYSEIGQIQFKTDEYGGTKQGLGLEDVKSALVPLPPLVEQHDICAELDCEIARVAAAVTAFQSTITLLREYRTRLIADVVTGKLDVREAAARLPDESAEDDAADSLEALGEDDHEPAEEGEVPEEVEA